MKLHELSPAPVPQRKRGAKAEALDPATVKPPAEDIKAKTLARAAVFVSVLRADSYRSTEGFPKGASTTTNFKRNIQL